MAHPSPTQRATIIFSSVGCPCYTNIHESEFLSNQSTLQQLMQVIHDRRDNPPAKSYTTSLFNAGVPMIGEKVMEEAGELVESAGEYCANRDDTTARNSDTNDEKKQHVIHEAADLVYHTLVMLSHCGLDFTDVEQELASRFGVSGIDEKNSRKK